MRLSVALSIVVVSATSVIAREQDQTVSVGPWTIATSFKAAGKLREQRARRGQKIRSERFHVSAGQTSWDVDIGLVRLNYRFGGFGAPIAARY